MLTFRFFFCTQNGWQSGFAARMGYLALLLIVITPIRSAYAEQLLANDPPIIEAEDDGPILQCGQSEVRAFIATVPPQDNLPSVFCWKAGSNNNPPKNVFSKNEARQRIAKLCLTLTDYDAALFSPNQACITDCCDGHSCFPKKQFKPDLRLDSIWDLSSSESHGGQCLTYSSCNTRYLITYSCSACGDYTSETLDEIMGLLQ